MQLDLSNNQAKQCVQTAVKCRFTTYNFNKSALKKYVYNLNFLERFLFFKSIILYNSIYQKLEIELIEEFLNIKFDCKNKDATSLILNFQKDILLLKLTSLQKIKHHGN